MIMEKLMINDAIKLRLSYFYVVLLMVNMTLIQPCVLDLGEWFACLIPDSVMQLFIIFIISIRCIQEYRI